MLTLTRVLAVRYVGKFIVALWFSFTVVFISLYMYQHLTTDQLATANLLVSFLMIGTLTICKHKAIRRYVITHTSTMVFTGIIVDGLTEVLVLVNPFVKLICDVVSAATFVQLFDILLTERLNCIITTPERRIQDSLNAQIADLIGAVTGSVAAIFYPVGILTAVIVSLACNVSWYMVQWYVCILMDKYATTHDITYECMCDD